MDGLVFINKEKNWTSRDVCNKVSHMLGERKSGHIGTLDPLATGVMVVCLGKYTKLANLLMDHDKEYKVEMELGYETDTLDLAGNVIKKVDVKVKEEDIINLFNNFPKSYIQEVPIYSALKVNGKKLYDYARNGEEVELPKREVKINNIKLLNINNNKIEFEVKVSKGTYIRSLVSDIAKKLGTVATMTNLLRTKLGNVKLEDTKLISDITKDDIKTISDILDYPLYELNEEEYKKVLNGNKLKLNSTNDRLILTKNNIEVGIYELNKEDKLYYHLFTTLRVN